MSERQEGQASQGSREHATASRPQSEADEDAAEILAGLINPENDVGTSKNAAQVGQKRSLESEEQLTSGGRDRIIKGDTRVRQWLDSVKGKFDVKPRSFRLATAAAAAHAEDCYWMWCYWNEDPAKHVDIKESHFRYNPAVYLRDSELKQALKRITTADEMEEFLKARYKTKKEERSPSMRKLNRITSITSRVNARSTVQKTSAVTAPRSIEEEEQVPSNQQRQQQQQEQPAGDVGVESSKVASLFEKAKRGKKLSPEELGDLFVGKTDQQQLSIAVHLGQEEVIKKLISGGTVDIDAPDPEYDGKTPLMLAATNCSIVSLELLLDANVDINKAHAETGETALMLAAEHPDGVHFIKTLFRIADNKHIYVKTDAGDRNKQTALMHAAIKGRYTLMHAAAQGSRENVRAIINYSKDRYGLGDALRHAAPKGQLEIVRMVIEHDDYYIGEFDFGRITKEVKTALEKAEKDNDKNLVLCLAKVLEELKDHKEQKAEERKAEKRRREEDIEENSDLHNKMKKFRAEEIDEQPKKDRDLEKSIKNRRVVVSQGGEAIPITVDSPDLHNRPELLKIVLKATVNGKAMEKTEVNTLLNSTAQLPISTAPPSRPAAGSLFLYNKTATPNYKKDEHNFGKESHTRLIVDKRPRIQVYYGTKEYSPVQRRSYYLISDDAERRGGGDQKLVLVHYLVPQASASKGKSQKSTGSEDQIASGSLDETIKADFKANEEADRAHNVAEERLPKVVAWDKPLHSHPPPFSTAPQSSPRSVLRSLIGIGVRLQIPGLDVEAICDDVNDLCDNPPAGCEEASKSGSINYHSLDLAAQELLNVKFDFIEAKMEREWKKAVANHEFAGLVKKLCNIVVEHFSVVSEDVRKALESAVLDEKASMATALRKLSKIDSIPKRELMNLVGIVTAAPLEWARDQFKVIRDAVLDDDIDFAKGLIHIALENKPDKVK
ncbi:putative Calmodulin-binding transcription activator CBT [Nannochloris sp. 'desiccata']|nr:putative Calmodulin-binding transcription activator CBT [Chlorella desiccata (nom. nud.)]